MFDLNEYWQQYVHKANNEEDVFTDDEQKDRAHKFCLMELTQAIKIIQEKNWKSVIYKAK